MTIISYNKSFVFVHLQKCGGTSIEKEWMKFIQWGDFVIGGSPEGETLQPVFHALYGIEKHSTAETLSRILGRKVFDRMTSLALVREPIKLIESDYRFALRLIGELARKHAKAPSQIPEIERRVREAVKQDNHPQIPSWWYSHHKGTVIEALLASSFQEYLERVCDNRWHRMLAKHVTNSSDRVIVTDLIKLEEPDAVSAFFTQKLKMPHFELRHDNKGKAISLQWPPDLRSKFTSICAYDYDLFKY